MCQDRAGGQLGKVTLVTAGRGERGRGSKHTGRGDGEADRPRYTAREKEGQITAALVFGVWWWSGRGVFRSWIVLVRVGGRWVVQKKAHTQAANLPDMNGRQCVVGE